MLVEATRKAFRPKEVQALQQALLSRDLPLANSILDRARAQITSSLLGTSVRESLPLQSVRALAVGKGLPALLGEAVEVSGQATLDSACDLVKPASPIPDGPKGAIIRKVLELRAQGKTYKAIAEEMGWPGDYNGKGYARVYSIIHKYGKAGKGTVPVPVGTPSPSPSPTFTSAEVQAQERLDKVLALQDMTRLRPGKVSQGQLAAFKDLVTEVNQVLPQKEQDSLRRYKGIGYQAINSSLRGGSGKSSYIKPIDQAISRSRTTHDMTVYRTGWVDPSNLEVGTVFQDKGFVSTGLNKGGAVPAFTYWEIKVPGGTNYALPCCNHLSEMEMLLPRGRFFKVVEVLEGPVGGIDWVEAFGRGPSPTVVNRLIRVELLP